MAATAFDRDSYISLRSFKRDGGAVDTPVWCAPLEGKLMIFTLGESYKVKRVARNPHVQVAKCDVRGKLLGPWQDGTCAMIERGTEHEAQAYAAFTRKYGIKMLVGNFFSSLVGRRKRRVVLEVALAA